MGTAPPRPHLLARSRSAEWADRLLERLWDSGLQPKPELDPAQLWTRGMRGFTRDDETHGRSEEDVADFRVRLDHLCTSLREESRLNALGLTMAFGQLSAAIRMRHALGRLWRDNPGIENTPIVPPIIVVGQMRSGTTRMHRLLAADPAHAGTRFCNGMNPIRKRFDLRPVYSSLGLAAARKINPWIDTLHPFGATRVDEELAWLWNTLDACAYEVQYHVPAYTAFSEARDAAPVYHEFARILRSDAAQMRNSALPRILKCPQYAEDLTPLLAQFPDARLVVTRRDMEGVLASSVSVVASQMAFQSDHADLSQIESEWRRKLALREARVTAALARFDGPLVEVDFDSLGADWLGEITRVYRQLDIDLSAPALTAMREEQSRAARSPHHDHRAAYRQAAKA